jgi:hypothetical protein
MKSKLRTLADWARANIRLLLLAYGLTLLACTNQTPKFPKALEAATAAVNLTDTALATAIQMKDPAPAELLTVWEPRVDAVDAAMNAVRKGEDVCKTLPGLVSVAVAVGCVDCVAVINQAKEQLQCL